MKASIVYFSGSGNTKYIADKLKGKLQEINFQVELINIDKNATLDKNTDLLIIGGPIYAGNVPEKLIRWVLKNVEDTDKAIKSIVYTTSAGVTNANGTNSLALKLQKKGYEVISKEIYLMPRNFYFGVYSENTEEEIKHMLEESENKINKLILNIKNNDLKKIETSSKGVLSKDLLAEFFSVIAKFMGKSFTVNEKCIKCGLCVRECPQNNIILKDNKIKFNRKCMMCTKCIHSCPKNAILYKGKRYNQYKLNNYLKK